MDADRHDAASGTPPAPRARRPWRAPAIRFVARVRDCVRGGGKTGANLDQDPNSTSKGGGG